MFKFSAHTLILSKLLTLLCFTNMGLLGVQMDMGNMAHAADPCHEQFLTSPAQTKNCDICADALSSWSEAYIKADTPELPDFVWSDMGETETFKIVLDAENTHKFVYRPPPNVIWVNAFHLPQKTTVLIV